MKNVNLLAFYSSLIILSLSGMEQKDDNPFESDACASAAQQASSNSNEANIFENTEALGIQASSERLPTIVPQPRLHSGHNMERRRLAVQSCKAACYGLAIAATIISLGVYETNTALTFNRYCNSDFYPTNVGPNDHSFNSSCWRYTLKTTNDQLDSSVYCPINATNRALLQSVKQKTDLSIDQHKDPSTVCLSAVSCPLQPPCMPYSSPIAQAKKLHEIAQRFQIRHEQRAIKDASAKRVSQKLRGRLGGRKR